MNDVRGDPDVVWRAVPHAYLRFRDGAVVASAPEADRHVTLPRMRGVLLWEALHAGGPVDELAAASSLGRHEVIALVEQLARAGIVTSAATAASSISFHDALMHGRSRGRTDEGFGPGIADAGGRDSQPGALVALPSVPPTRLDDGATFTQVLDQRRTTRDWSNEDLSLDQVSEFLWRLGHARPAEDGGPRSYPYPYAGPDGCERLALAAGRVDGLASSLYLYEPTQHAVRRVTPRLPGRAACLPLGKYLATVAAGQRVGDRHPQAMLLVLSDLERMSRAYQGIAYANVLKTTGVILATASLCATAARLGSTILGLASDADFRDLYAEALPGFSCTGELALGVPWPPRSTGP